MSYIGKQEGNARLRALPKLYTIKGGNRMIEGKELMEFQSSVKDMESRLAEMGEQLDIVQRFFQKIMVKNQDYGIIPGTDKPTLLKPGAEKLCELYGFAPIIKEIKEEKNNETGFCHYLVIITLVHKRSGAVVAEGVGEANTNEDKFRWRWIPEWKLVSEDKSLLQFRTETTKDGRQYRLYKVENQSPFSLWNTILKIAKKRALVDATLSATRSSGIFTQDMEDLQDWIDAEVIEAEPSKPQTNNTKTTNEVQKLSEAQIRLLYGKAKEKGLTSEALHKMINEVAGKDSVKDIDRKELETLLKAIEDIK